MFVWQVANGLAKEEHQLHVVEIGDDLKRHHDAADVEEEDDVEQQRASQAFNDSGNCLLYVATSSLLPASIHFFMLLHIHCWLIHRSASATGA